ncbi:hypothetical protein V6N13_022083 [Hibiscus sabdariffa]
MYDANFVQQVLVADGFKVKVSVWSGFFTLVYFEEEEQMEIFWDLKETLLDSWFVSIDSLDSFIKLKKLNVWAVLEGFPIEAWQEPVFVSLVNKWGLFVKLDEDTIRKNRLDCARILIRVSLVSDIPQQVVVSVNGTNYMVRVSTMEFEDDRCWIDQDQAKGHIKKSDDLHEHIGNDSTSNKSAGLSRTNKPKSNPKINKLGSKDLLDIAAQSVLRPSFDELCGLMEGPSLSQMKPRSNSRHLHGSFNSKNLLEVPIREQMELNSSHGNNISIEPVFNEVTGLYSIKTKYAKNDWPHCSPSSKYQFPGSSLRGGFNFEGRSNRASSPSSIGAKKMHEDKLFVEAKEALEVCKSLGLQFKANDVEVIKRFIDLDVEACGVPQ